MLLIYLGRRGYHLERDYKNDPSFGVNVLKRLVAASEDEEKFLNNVKSIGATHILMRVDLVDRFLKLNYSEDVVKRFIDNVNEHWKLLYKEDFYAVWQI